MNLGYDEVEESNGKAKLLKRLIIVSIVILSIVIIVLLALIRFKLMNPTYITTYIDGKQVENFDQILDIQENENGETEFYIPIRLFASCLKKISPEFQYEDFEGEYDIKTEDKNSCHIVRKDYEVTVYNKGSKTIYKKNLQNGSKEYEEYTIDKDIFINDNILYASEDGIEKGFNVTFSYEPKKKIINIYTLDYISKNQRNIVQSTEIGTYGTLDFEIDELNNIKSIFEGVLIVRAENGQYGLLSADYKEFILEPKYDDITYIPDCKNFLVKSNGKVGLFTKEGKKKIGLEYQEITSMGNNSNLYVVKNKNLYGVVDITKPEDNNIIIHTDYEQIGIDVSDFAYNGVKNGYIILDELIPIRQDRFWALYNKKGKIVSDGFKYTNIGCGNVKNGNNVHPVLQIKDLNIIAVCDKTNKYGFMDINGRDSIVPFLLNYIYIKTSAGEDSYWMSYKYNEEEREVNVLDYLKQKK